MRTIEVNATITYVDGSKITKKVTIIAKRRGLFIEEIERYILAKEKLSYKVKIHWFVLEKFGSLKKTFKVWNIEVLGRYGVSILPYMLKLEK